MKGIDAYAISLTLNLQAGRCRCDLDAERPGICPQCECLGALADAVLAYDDRCLLQHNREVRGVLD